MTKILLAVFALFTTLSGIGQSEEKIKSLLKDSEAAKEAFIKQDEGLSKFFNSAPGYVIFPNVGKGGLGVGGASGNGILYVGGKEIGTAKLTQVTIGLQAGGQAYREVIFFENNEQLEKFKGNKV